MSFQRDFGSAARLFASSLCFSLLCLPAVAAEPIAGSALRVTKDPASGQLDITDADRPVFRYNYQTIEPGERLSQIHSNNWKYPLQLRESSPRSIRVHWRSFAVDLNSCFP